MRCGSIANRKAGGTRITATNGQAAAIGLNVDHARTAERPDAHRASRPASSACRQDDIERIGPLCEDFNPGLDHDIAICQE